MKVVVTGSSGLLGSHVVGALQRRGHSVVGVDLAAPAAGAPRPASAVQVSFGAYDVPPDAEAVVHLACSSLPATSAAAPEVDLAENVVGSVALFRGAVRAGAKKVVFASSGGTVYGEMPPGRNAWTEDDPAAPVTAHGAMKLAVETYLRVTCRGTATRPVVLRIGNAYGRRGAPRAGHGAVENFVHALLRGGEVTVWGDGSAVRDYVHAEDVADAVAAAVEAAAPSPLYNVATGRGTSLRELAERAAAACGLPARVRHVAARGVDLARSVLDCSRARAELNWAPRVTIEEGLARLAAEARKGS